MKKTIGNFYENHIYFDAYTCNDSFIYYSNFKLR